ncbi:MAG: vitamin-B12 independent methionine synthase [Candidatus Binatia bacterium]
MSEGGYEAISRQLFRKLQAQRLLLEYDDARSGSLKALADVPDDKLIVLGLITTKKPQLESLELLRRRVTAANRYVPMERLGLSPQCGFASSIIGNRITAADQRRKLQLLVNAAREIWG